MVKSRFLRRVALVAILAAPALGPATAGAQARLTQDAQPKAPAKGAPEGRSGSLTAELMYRLLVGDIALQRGDTALAARAYFEAARDTRDARLARRATEIALVARQRGLAADAARLWIEIDPAAERPKQVLAGLSRGGSGGGGQTFSAELKAELERALAEAAATGSRVGDAFLELNRILSNEPDRAATLALVRSLAQPYPDLPEAQFAVAVAAFNTGMSDAATATVAMQAVDRALAQKPGWEQAVLLKAQILAKQSADRAADYLVDFLRGQPESKPAQAALAQVRIQQKNFTEAIAIFRRLWEKDKSNRDYLFGMAMLSIQIKDWTNAEALFDELKRARYGEDGVVEFYLAQIAEESGRYELALERYRAVPEGERGWLAKLRVAAVLGRLGRMDEARRHLADLPAVTIEQRVQVRQTEAQVLRDAGDNERAFAILTQALTEHADEPDLLYDLAMVAEKLGRLDVTEAKLKRLIELRPANAHALNALGYTLVDRTPRIAEGLALIERALALSPDDPFILDSMGWAQFRMGRLDDAEKSLRKALEQRPDPEIAAHLGEVLWVKGDRERAREIWQTQLKSAPDNQVLLETMRRLTR